MKIEIEVSQSKESTSSPWWMIIDPKQNFEVGNQGLHNIAAMITGPFFSREEAESVLNARHYNYSKHAKVYCHSGCYTHQYQKAYRNAEMQQILETTNAV